MSKKSLTCLAFTLVFGLGAAPSTEAAICGPVGGTTYNVTSAEAIVSCYDLGTGNMSDTLTGYTFIDKDEAPSATDAGFSYSSNTNTGTFAIDASVWMTYSTLVVGFKAGNTWAQFLLDPTLVSGTLDGVYNFQPPQGAGLSHAVLWGTGTPTPPTAVPEPATLLTMGAGLTVLARRLRRRTT